MTPDIAFAKTHDDGSGVGIGEDTLAEIFREKKIGNVSLIKGDVFETLPSFLKANSHLKISLLDMDIYQPTNQICARANLG